MSDMPPTTTRKTASDGAARCAFEGGASILAAALLLGGCASAPAAPPVELSAIYGQLADACRRENGPLTVVQAERSDIRQVPRLNDRVNGSIDGRQSARRPTVATPDSCIATGTLPKAVEAAGNAARFPVDFASAPAILAADVRDADVDGAEPRGGELPQPLKLRYAPSSIELRRNEALALAAKFSEAASRDDVRLTIAVGRGGIGNAFEQVMMAHNRVRLINEMLPPRLVASSTFDPELADDTLIITFVATVQ